MGERLALPVRRPLFIADMNLCYVDSEMLRLKNSHSNKQTKIIIRLKCKKDKKKKKNSGRSCDQIRVSGMTTDHTIMD